MLYQREGPLLTSLWIFLRSWLKAGTSSECECVCVCVCVVLGKTLWTSQTAKGFMIKHLKILHRPSSFLSPHAVIAHSSERLSNASPRLRPVSEAML